MAYSILILGLISVQDAWAETKYLFIDGGQDRISNFSRFYNSVRHGYETVESVKPHARSVLAKDGKWRISPLENANPASASPPTFPPARPARSLADLYEGIKALKPKASDAIVIYLTGHGGAPRPGDPGSASLLLWDEIVDYHDFAAMLAGKFPGRRFRIVADTCYGGGAHHLARELDHVCVASTVPYFTESYDGDSSEGLFSQGFWNHYRAAGGRTSLAGAALAGFANDHANFQLGRLSSFDYVDYVLQKGPYERPRDTIQPTELAGRDGRGHDTIAPPADYAPVLPPDALIAGTMAFAPPDAEGRAPTGCLKEVVDGDVSKLSAFSAAITSLFAPANASSAKALIRRNAGDPEHPGLGTIFERVVDDMKRNSADYLYRIAAINAKYEEQRAHWRASAKTMEDRTAAQAAFDHLRAEASLALKPVLFDHEMLKRLALLGEFAEKASPKEKAKFKSLLECEWESL